MVYENNTLVCLMKNIPFNTAERMTSFISSPRNIGIRELKDTAREKNITVQRNIFLSQHFADRTNIPSTITTLMSSVYPFGNGRRMANGRNMYQMGIERNSRYSMLEI